MKLFTLLFSMLLLAGCSYFVSWDDLSKTEINRPIFELFEFESWQNPDEIKTLPNGGKEYKYWFKKLSPPCIHYWIVDAEGIITGYRYEGYCRPVG